MKTLIPISVSQSDGKVTVEFSYGDKQYSKYNIRQVTLLHFAEGNPTWVRHVQISEEGLFVKRMGQGLALDLDEWVTKVANVLEPQLACPPKGKVIKTPNLLKAEINSELNPTFQWQYADKPNTPSEQWQDITGETTDILSVKPELKGKFARCFAKSDAGPLATPPVAV